MAKNPEELHAEQIYMEKNLLSSGELPRSAQDDKEDLLAEEKRHEVGNLRDTSFRGRRQNMDYFPPPKGGRSQPGSYRSSSEAGSVSGSSDRSPSILSGSGSGGAKGGRGSAYHGHWNRQRNNQEKDSTHRVIYRKAHRTQSQTTKKLTDPKWRDGETD